MIKKKDCLSHHGIKGQKWGVRRYQNYDGTLISSSRNKHNKGKESLRESTRRMLNYDTDARREMSKLDEKWEKKFQDFDKNNPIRDDEWWEKDGRLTKKARERMDKYDAMWEQRRKEEKPLNKLHDKQIVELRKKVIFNEKVKDDIYKARKLNKDLDGLREKTIGENSEYADKGYKEYIKNHKDDSDPEYGYFHYQWRSGSGDKYYEQAQKEFKAQSNKMRTEYENTLSKIGKTICEDASDIKVPKLTDSEKEFLEFELDQILSFRDEYFKK